MKILLLGVGMQGRAALHDLASQDEVKEIIAADLDVASIESFPENKPYKDKVRFAALDARDEDSLKRLMREDPDVVLDLLPVPLHEGVTRAVMEQKVHLVTASYMDPAMKRLADEARSRRITLLPEMGMDPGLDLILLGRAVRLLDRVEEIESYGAGFPEPAASNNPLKYKVTWNFEGVLSSYHRPARLLKDGGPQEIGEKDLFHPRNIHEIEIEGLGTLEAFPNGDALEYLDLLGLEASSLTKLARYVLRWPGHAAFWKRMVDSRLLDDEPVDLDGTLVDRKRYMAAALEPLLQYEEHERDVVVVRVEARGEKEGKPGRAVFQIIDHRDLGTGFTAMSRTVGFTAGIGALMVASGRIDARGLLSPIKDIPFEPFAEALSKRGIEITTHS
ncbi:MAG: saccharopine dehydrogenase family protein [Planctomycetota bacterium]|jgi:saccharopine dehydrogenase-like NADP-dependent oxidoreductase